MSVMDVTARIQQIQSQLSILRPTTGTASTSGPEFDGALADALDPAGTGSTPGAVTGEDVVAEARKYLGLPYVWGGTSKEKGVDCSGLVQSVYKTLGFDLPRVSADQARSGRPVASLAEARPGDLLAWDNSSRNNGADHIAIYIGGGKMIEAPRTGLDVRIVDVPSTPDAIRRILPGTPVAATSSAASSSGSLPAGTPYARLFESAAARYDVPAPLLAAVAKQESGFDAHAVSPAGARGLMQLMPATARGLGVTDPLDPAQAVDGAARMLRDLTHRFGRVDLALAAYNAGPGAVLKYDGIPPYPETRNYVRKVLAGMEAL